MKAVLPLLAVASLITPALGQSLVTTNADSGAGSLRQAILDTNANAGAEIITFDNSLAGQTIRLTSGELEITDDLTIDGSALANPVTITGDADESGTPTAADSRVFRAENTKTVVLDSLIITGGKAPDGTEYKGDSGGGIYSAGAFLEIRNCWVHGNAAGNGNDSHPDGAGGDGGGIHASRTTRILNSTISNNRTGVEGSNATSAVTGGNGGGIFFSGVLIVENSTISGNEASSRGEGGGIYTRGANEVLYLVSSTVSKNQAGEGEGAGISGIGVHLHIKSSIVAGNSTPTSSSFYNYPDLRLSTFVVTSYGSNLIGDNGGSESSFPTPSFKSQPNFFGDFVGTPNNPLSPGLSSLAHNGGIGPTHLPLPDSPAINPPTGYTTARFPTDQRGSIRVLDGVLDIGAVEVADPIIKAKVVLKKKIAALKRKLRIAKRKKQRAKVRRITRTLKKLQRRLRSIG